MDQRVDGLAGGWEAAACGNVSGWVCGWVGGRALSKQKVF